MSTSEWLTPPPPRPLSGQERFAGLDATVLDFWAYAMSDLRMNNVRGYLAEFLVAKAVGATARRTEWDDYDVLTPTGVRIEVKSAAYLQSWDQPRVSTIRFTGLRGRRLTPPGSYALEATFNADVYVFAVQTTRDHADYDPLDVSPWRFYVLPGPTVAGAGYASMSLSTIQRLGATEIVFDDLGHAIKVAAPTHQEAPDVT